MNSLLLHDFKFFTTLSPTKILASFQTYSFFYDSIQSNNQTRGELDGCKVKFFMAWEKWNRLKPQRVYENLKNSD